VSLASPLFIPRNSYGTRSRQGPAKYPSDYGVISANPTCFIAGAIMKAEIKPTDPKKTAYPNRNDDPGALLKAQCKPFILVMTSIPVTVQHNATSVQLLPTNSVKQAPPSGGACF